MLCLRFRMDGSSFGLESGRILELIPLVELWPVRAAPLFIRGCFSFRGLMVPVADIALLLSGKPSRRRFSSRIAIVDQPGGLLGLLLEDAIETITIDDADFQNAPVKIEETPYLGRLAVKEGDLLQIVKPDALLTDALRALLFQEVK